MSADQRFSLLLTALGLLFLVCSALLGLLWRSAVTWGRLTEQVKNLAESVGQIALDTNERLQWLERASGRERRP